MTGYLIDTSVLSAFAPGRGENLPAGVSMWFAEHGDSLFLSTMTIAEIEKGICKQKRSGATKRAAELDEWLNQIETAYAQNILPFDSTAARLAGRIDDIATAKGKNPGLADIIIAATAQANDLTVLTANLRHFEALGVKCVNPLERLD